MTILLFLARTMRISVAAVTAVVVAAVVVAPTAYASENGPKAITALSPETAVANPNPLPKLGFSLNGEALSGPPSQAHYNTLARMSPDTWARVGFNGDGKWRDEVDKYLGPIRKAGMKVLIRASFREAVLLKRVPLNATEQERYGDFVRELAQYVKTKYALKPNEVVFEHPNESNRQVSGAAYAGAAKNAYPKLKSVDPGYKIIGASENVYVSNWKSWLSEVYAAGYASASDGVSFHNYDAQGSHERYAYLESIMKKHGHWGSMVWLTEFGTTTPPGAKGNGSAASGRSSQTEAGQAVRLTGVLKFLQTDYPWITHAFVYADEDIHSRKSSNKFEAHFGIFANDQNGTVTREKPAVQAIRNLYATQAPAPAAPVVKPPAANPVGSQSQTLASFPLNSAAPAATGQGVTVSPIKGTGFATGPRYGDFAPAYKRAVMQMNPTTKTASSSAAYVETAITPSVAGQTVTVESIQLKAARGGDATNRGLRIVAHVDGVTTTLLSKPIATQRPMLSTFTMSGLSLKGKDVRIRVYPFSPVSTATVELADLVITGRVTAASAAPASNVAPAPPAAPAPTVAPAEPAANPVKNQLQTLASFALSSAAPATVGQGATVTPITGARFSSAPLYADFSPAYKRKVLQTNPSAKTPSSDAAYVETTITPSVAGETVSVESIQLKAARGGDATVRGLLIVAVVDGVATTVLSQPITTQRPTLSTFNVTGLSLEGKEVRIRVYPYSPTPTATVELADLVIEGRING